MRVNGKEIPLNAPISLQAFLLEQHDFRISCLRHNFLIPFHCNGTEVSPRKQNRRKFHAEKRI